MVVRVETNFLFIGVYFWRIRTVPVFQYFRNPLSLQYDSNFGRTLQNVYVLGLNEAGTLIGQQSVTAGYV